MLEFWTLPHNWKLAAKLFAVLKNVRDLQHAHVHDNRGQLVLAAEAALNDVHSQVAD